MDIIVKIIILFSGILITIIVFFNLYSTNTNQKISLERCKSVSKRYLNCPTSNDNTAIPLHKVCQKRHDVMNIYHIMIDRFNGGWSVPPRNRNHFLGGNLKGIIDKLDYIGHLGYDTIMLTPIYKTNAYHGYHILDYEKIDLRFGNWDEFRQLIYEVHKRDMRIICDFVPNHCHKDCHLHTEKGKKQWFKCDDSGKEETFAGIDYLPKFDLKNPKSSAYMIDRAIHLIKLGVDGLRIDHAIGVPLDFLSILKEKVHEVNHNALVIGEVCPANSNFPNACEYVSEERRQQVEKKMCLQDDLQRDYTNRLDGVFDFALYEILIEEMKANGKLTMNQRFVERIQNHYSLYPDGFILIPFLDNHDLNRFMYYCNGDRSVFDNALWFVKSLGYGISVYYGSEDYMTNKTNIEEGNFADLEVREAKRWTL